MSPLALLPVSTCGVYTSCCCVRSSPLRAPMTTVTLPPSSSLQLCKSPPYSFRSSFSSSCSSLARHNAEILNPRQLSFHRATSCVQKSPLSVPCGSPHGSQLRMPCREGRRSRGPAYRQCEGDQVLCSLRDEKTSTLLGTSLPTTAEYVEEGEERLCAKLQALPASLASEVTADGGRVNSQVSSISSLGLLLSSLDLISRHCRPNRAGGRPAVRPVEPSADESLSRVSTKHDVSSNVVSQVCQQLHSGLFDNQLAVVKLGMIMSVLGLQICSQAWAGPEVAQINLNSGLDLGNFSDIQDGFASAFLLIFFSEIGDKTFFIAALLATRKPSVAVFSGTFGALMVMTVISVCLGRVFHYVDAILPSFGNTKLPVDDIAAVILLVYFGVSTLLDAASMEDSASGEEQQEAELAIANVGAGGAVAGTVAATFALVFVAEWGDKSFFSTIALAAAASPIGVVTGAIAGHGAATLLAVLGGSFLGNYISEKTIAYVGGVLFLVFAGTTLAEILN